MAESAKQVTSLPPPPPISHVLETILYVRDMDASVKFYSEIFGLEPFIRSPRISGFALGTTTLLLFQLGLTSEDVYTAERGTLPGHGPTSAILDLLLLRSDSDKTSSRSSAPTKEQENLKHHFCLAVLNREDVDVYKIRLEKMNVSITGVMEWERGGKSVYFADPDGHVGEIGSRGIWEHF